MSEFERPYTLSEFQNQVEVFGFERMAELRGNEAGAEITDHFIAVIKNLCRQPTFTRGGDIYHRVIEAENGVPLELHFNPRRKGGLGDNEVDRAYALIDNLKYEPKSVKTGLFSTDTVHDKEGIFINTSGRAMIRKIVVLPGESKQRVAFKPATELEIVEAVDTLLEACQYESRRQ